MEIWKQKLIDRVEENGDFLTDVDGYVKFCPKVRGGCLESHHLRVIADELDRRNKDWDEQIRREIGQEQ